MPIKNGMVDVQCVGTLFLVEGLCFHWEQTEAPDKIQQNISLKYRELLRQPGLKGTTIWERGSPQNPHSRRVRGSGWGRWPRQMVTTSRWRSKQNLWWVHGTWHPNQRLQQIPREKGKQRTKPSAAGFPLKMFAEFRSCVGQKTKNQGRKPLKDK